MNLGCQYPRQFYCHDHLRVYCHTCAIHLHTECKTEEIREFDMAQHKFDQTEIRIKRIDQFDKLHSLGIYFQNFDQELEYFKTQLGELKTRLSNAKAKCLYFESYSLENDAQLLLGKILASEMFRNYTKYKDGVEACDTQLFRDRLSPTQTQEITDQVTAYKEGIAETLKKENEQKLEEAKGELKTGKLIF